MSNKWSQFCIIITLALSTYNISTEDRKEIYFFPDSPLTIDLSPIGEATIISQVSKFVKYTIFFFLGRIFKPTRKKSSSSSSFYSIFPLFSTIHSKARLFFFGLDYYTCFWINSQQSCINYFQIMSKMALASPTYGVINKNLIL